TDQLPLLVGGELVVEGNHHGTAVENGVGGNKPLRLVGHDDRSTITSLEAGVLQRTSQELRALLEIAVREAFLLALAIGFDEASLIGKFVEGVLQCRADGLILRKIEHQRRDWMREARVRKSLTPCTS